MTDNNHPITPPPELVQQLWGQCPADSDHLFNQFATLMARWGADQELEACCADLRMVLGPNQADWLRSVRRPKPPSLKELALTQLDSLHADLKMHGLGTNTDTIRRALEQLDV